MKTPDATLPLATATGWMVTADAAATWWWLHAGLAIEGNPLVAWLIEAHGLTAGLAIRTVAVLGLLVAVTSLRQRTRWVERGLMVAAGVYALVVGWHLEGALSHLR
jgi:hypothetical protein